MPWKAARARPLTTAIVAVLGVVFVVNGVRGNRAEPEALKRAASVMVDSGPTGVAVIRDGAVIRIDRQSPPYNLLIPPPTTEPWPDGIAVGRQHVWVSSQGLVRGHVPGSPRVREFRITPSEPLLLAEGRNVLWAATPGTRRLYHGSLLTRRATFVAVAMPGVVRDLDAQGHEAWAVVDAPGGSSRVVRVIASRPGARTVVQLPEGAWALATAVRSVWVLTRRGVYHIDRDTLAVRGPLPTVPGSKEIAATTGRVLTLAPAFGVVMERRRDGVLVGYDVGRGSRALAAGRRGLWVSEGDAATPRFVRYRDP